MNRNQGWTIIQVMLVLLIAGFVLAFAADYLVDRRCAEDPARQICAKQ